MPYKGDWEKGEIEILEPISIFKNKFIEIYNDKVKFPSGYEGTYIRVAAPINESVAILPVTKDGKIVLIKTFRHGTRSWGYEVPKGGICEKEEAIHAAERELREETGAESDNYLYVGEYSDSPAIYSNFLKCFIAFDCEITKENSIEDSEAIESILITDPAEFLNLEASIGFKDALTEMMIYKYLFLVNQNNE